jgi:hypothetical protein
MFPIYHYDHLLPSPLRRALLPRSTEDPDVLDSLPECDEHASSQDRDARCAEIEHALLGMAFTLSPSLRLPSKPRTTETVKFDIVNIGWGEAPQYLDDPYRRTSISKIRPLPAEIDNA